VHQRPQRVRASAQEAALVGGERGRRGGHAPSDSRRGGWRAPGRTYALRAVALAALLAACAHDPGPRRVDAWTPPAPRPAAGLDVVLPRERSDLVLPPDEDPRLALARSVLGEAAGGRLEALEREGIAHELVRAERDHGLPAHVLLAVIEQESRFDPRAQGPRGSLGLMQVKVPVGLDVARRHGIPFAGRATLFDPVANVRIGITYLAEQLRAFGDVRRALAAYQLGPTRLRRRLAAGATPDVAYVTGVLRRAERLRLRFDAPVDGLGG
jgi:soluble lytic murein transglycosylase